MVQSPDRSEAVEYYFKYIDLVPPGDVRRFLVAQAWSRSGTASGNPFTVRALAYLTAGHLIHHTNVLRERYLRP